MDMLGIAFCVFYGNIIGNFIWEIFTDKNWEEALERGIFQGFVILSFLIALYWNGF